MPHDKYGSELKVGDKVLVPCVVESVGQTEEACNVTVKAALPALGSEYTPVVTMNSRQVVKADFPCERSEQ